VKLAGTRWRRLFSSLMPHWIIFAVTIHYD
jgi:hypothetical protein